MQGEGIYREKKNDRPMSAASSRKCSNHLISGVPDSGQIEPLSPPETAQFFDSLPFPQRELLAPLITNPSSHGFGGDRERQALSPSP